MHFELGYTLEIGKHFDGADRLVPVVQSVDHEEVEAAARSIRDDLRPGPLRLIAAPLGAYPVDLAGVCSWNQQRKLREISTVQWKLLGGILRNDIPDFSGFRVEQRLGARDGHLLLNISDLDFEILLNDLLDLKDQTFATHCCESRSFDFDGINGGLDQRESIVAILGCHPGDRNSRLLFDHLDLCIGNLRAARIGYLA